MSQTEQKPIIYRVVVNHEEQYSIWRASMRLPAGWREVGKTGPEEECLAYISSVWTDMRPLSVRKQLAAMQAAAQRDADSCAGVNSSISCTTSNE
jgi:MbtH protein